MNAHILKVPYDSGHRCERMARGPGYLLSNHVLDGVPVEAIETNLAFTAEIQTAFDLARQISTRTHELRAEGKQVVVFSGNCNSALGTLSGLGAHGEFHTPETTHSGFLDGMPLSIATGRSWRTLAKSIPHFVPVPDENVALIGLRDTDPEEQLALDASGIHLMRDTTNASDVLKVIAARVCQWYIHLDLDALDPSAATSNAWTPPGGLRASEIAAVIRHACSLLPIAGIAVASLDPAVDKDGRALSIARDLLATALS
jgi:arginase family enzyme